ncbi:MAG TPA: Mrr restriction system protein [Alphaproteobacteria bacterium]|nr:Mrr restriction system protein [Alphaproteobacteria bacterium]
MEKAKGPQFLRFCIPIVETLKELGGSGQPKEVTDAVLERLHISEQEQAQTLKNGSSRARNQVAWARFYLAKADFLDASRRGVWALTEKGRTIHLSPNAVFQLFKDVHTNFPTKDEKPKAVIDETEIPPPADPASDRAGQRTLLDVLKSLPPGGFERVSQRLLRESGFERVIVTGRSGDGGIDGHGILQVNPFVSFTVLFQCKRYAGAVSASQVRDFRGAMMGRADKGIIITTGTFTTEATKEARRDGAPPIELVDGEALVRMFERLELGVKPKTVYEVDEAFFEEYR